MKFNINNNVRVKLTDLGRKLHRENHNKIFEFAAEFRTDDYYNEFYAPIEDSAGWSTWQFWELMQIFGPYLYNGGEVPFETEIEILDEKL